MLILEVMLAFVVPYLLAWVAALLVQRAQMLPPRASSATLARNEAGRLTGAQRRALLYYAAPELLFTLAAILIALWWQPVAGPNSAALRWGLAGMAVVRVGISTPLWADLIAGRVELVRGPLRKIQFGQRRALATEDGPLLVLPVERGIFTAYEAGAPATIFYTPHTKRVVAVVARATATAPTDTLPAPA